MIPAKKIPMFCNTIGTGINGKGTPGTNPKMQIMAVIKAVKTKFFVLTCSSSLHENDYNTNVNFNK